MIKILFATGNETKGKRFSKGLKERGIEVITLKDIDNNLDVQENGKDAIENALIKAREYAKVVDIPVFAMDDNLYLENVPEDKQPGMFVRRVNGKRLSDDEMIEHYTKLVKEYGIDGKLTCRWVYGMAVINKGKESTYTWSKEDFYMVDVPSNRVDPGYPLNTISLNKKLNKYFTDITEEDKVLLQEDESNVVDFIANCILENRMKNIQEKVEDKVKKYNLESSPEIRFIDLVSEIGELGKELLKGNDYGKKDLCNTDNIESEIGDVFFSLICVANDLNIDMQKALDGVLKKYEERFSNKGNIGSGR